MFGFLIKKAFFNFWDSMLKVILLNLGFIIILGIGVYLPYLLRSVPVLSFITIFAAVILFNLYAGGASMYLGDVADYKSPEIRDLFKYIKEVWKSGLLLGIITCIQILLLVVAFPFYMSLGGILGMVAVSLLFWASLIWWLGSQFFFPTRKRLDTSSKKIIKKCFILFFDNTGFTIMLALGTAATFVISIFTALLLPGIAGILLWHQEALKLRLYKYDYLEKNPDANRKQIPWESLLYDDREKVGHRTLKGMIFPWKE